MFHIIRVMHGEDYWGDHDAFRPERFIDRETGAFRYGTTEEPSTLLNFFSVRT